MRISDWSSDVCSSDLRPGRPDSSRARRAGPSGGSSCPAYPLPDLPEAEADRPRRHGHPAFDVRHDLEAFEETPHRRHDQQETEPEQRIDNVTQDRKSVRVGKSGSVRLDLGGRPLIKKKKKK